MAPRTSQWRAVYSRFGSFSGSRTGVKKISGRRLRVAILIIRLAAALVLRMSSSQSGMRTHLKMEDDMETGVVVLGLNIVRAQSSL